MARVAVIGLGRIGLRVAWELVDMGYTVRGFDASSSAVERAERLLGIEARVVDVTRLDGLRAALADADVAAVALPGGLGLRVLRGVVSLGVDAVDVSFYREDPYLIDPAAKRFDVTVVVDAGVAPGLSNLLVGELVKMLPQPAGAKILVGGVSLDPDAPLGLAATWSIHDLLDEYLRPARAIVNGRLEELKPLENVVEVEVPRVGRMEAIPTDGLRTMLRNLRALRWLSEYTLRWPGHARVVRELMELGLFNEKPVAVGGCAVSPRDLLARLLEQRLKGERDLLVLLVEAWGGGRAAYLSVSRHDGEWSAMARATAGFQAKVVDLVARGVVRGPGVVAPEELAWIEGVTSEILGHLASRGVPVEPVQPVPGATGPGGGG